MTGRVFTQFLARNDDGLGGEDPWAGCAVACGVSFIVWTENNDPVMSEGRCALAEFNERLGTMAEQYGEFHVGSFTCRGRGSVIAVEVAVNEKKSRVRIGAGQRGSNSDEQGAVTANDEWVTSTMKQVSDFIPNHPGEAQEVSEADDTRGCVADRIGDSDLQVARVLDIECLHHTCSPKGSRHQLTSDEPSRAVRWDTEQDVEHSRYRVSSCRKSRAALM